MVSTPQNRGTILFVDDEESVRITLPPVLARYGFDVRTAATLNAALDEINSRRYDVLLSDLNIEAPGDGFMLIGAMRHAQPNCATFLLTGYPSIESALQAIRAQVDDYFVKPADTAALVDAITKKIQSRPRTEPCSIGRLFTILRENVAVISAAILAKIKNDPETSSVPLSDQQRADHLPVIFRALVEQLESDRDHISAQALAFSLEHGQRRKKQGYTLHMTLRDFQLIEQAVLEYVARNFLPQWTAEAFSDLRRLTQSVHVLTLESIKAYQQAPRSAPSRSSKRRAKTAR